MTPDNGTTISEPAADEASANVSKAPAETAPVTKPVSAPKTSAPVEETPVDQPSIDAKRFSNPGFALFQDEYSGIGGTYVIDPQTGKRVPDPNA